MTTNASSPAPGAPLEMLLVGSFNLANLASLLAKDPELQALRPQCAPYGQVTQTLLNPATWGADIQGAVVWTLPENASLGFKKLLDHQEAAPEEIAADVDAFCQAVRRVPATVKHIFVPTWILPPDEGRLGPLDLDARRGVSRALLRMNLRLAENLDGDPRVTVLDASRWVARHGEKSFSLRLWRLSKTPFGTEFFREAAAEIRSSLRALAGQARKLIVLDLDDTLWGGILGEVGWQQLRLGGHDAVGEAFSDFQNALKALKNRGVLLGVASKNEEATALEAIRSHPEMALRLDDFAGWRINWNDKARNIADLAAELNLGLQSVVFIDDNPVERARVREALPEVLAPDWPENPMEYKAALQRLRCFDQGQISAEDRERGAMYVFERKRRESAAEFQSVDDWLRTLQMTVAAEPITEANLERVAQLFNKTNQMNLSTRRLTKAELWSWVNAPENDALAFRVADKFGDYGLVGLASVTWKPGADAQLVDFILSCRVMGRQVEETMLHVLFERARERGARRARAEYVPTPKNQPCLAFFQRALKAAGEHIFAWDLTEPYARPGAIALTLAEAPAR